jgi:DNA-binding response OmpR family regulator
VEIHSELGLGTTVTVLLPVTDQCPAAADRGGGEAEFGHGELVLVVEDEPALREVTRRILARGGYEVMVAASGQEAISVASACQSRIDAVVTDVVMPGIQGKEVASRVCELHPGIGVLYMSGYTAGLLSAQGVLEQGINLLEKPFTEAALLKKMRAVLDR